jgi:AraC family transcriptional regulator
VESISPDELERAIGLDRILLASDALGLSDLVLRSYAVPASMEVAVPPLQDYALTMHLAGPMTMDRRIDVGSWKRELLVPGTVSVLTRAVPSTWHNALPTKATHLYLSRGLLTRVFADSIATWPTCN